MRKRIVALVAAAPLAAGAHSRLDAVEHIFGATNIHAITGHGRLTVGLSAEGDVTVLTWPNPSQVDQLAYITSNAFDARDRPRFGAPEGGGLFLGLRLETGAGPVVTWLRDAAVWTIEQGADANVATTYESARFGLRVTVVDAVRPGEGAGDTYVREVRVVRTSPDPDDPVSGASLLTYANLSPNPPNARVPELPVTDWAYDGRNDFAAVWDENINAIMHFHPSDQLVRDEVLELLGAPAVDYGPIGAALRAGAADAAALAASLDADYAPGAYLALTTQPPPDQHQVGVDATDWCGATDALVDNLFALPERFPDISLPVQRQVLDTLRCPEDRRSQGEREGWPAVPADALADAQDGELAGDGVAAGEVNGALRTPLRFEDDEALAFVVLGAGPDAATARAALAVDAGAVPAEAQAALDAWLAGVALPQGASEAVRRVARRSMINLRVGTVAENGAIVASIARQAPYGLDWPRDGAFFNTALDAAGLHDLVTRRADLYLTWQRQTDARATPLVDPPPPPDPSGGPAVYPAGAWEMNYYADGAPGGTWRFEIDNTAFALWTLCAHAAWLPEAERAPYLRARWGGIRAAADLLTRWRDPETGLHAPAQEDDNPAYTQTLHGAVTVAGSLALAARAARLAGEEADAGRWAARAAEVREAIVTRFYDAEAGVFGGTPDVPLNPGSAPTGPTAWLVWPMHVLPWDDPRVEAQLRADLDAVTPAIELRGEGGAYFLKNLAATALARGHDPAWRPRIEALLEQVASHATPTGHFGEVTLVRDGRADQRVSTPHLWEGILFYLTAMALEAPERILRYDTELPTLEAPAPDAGPPDAGPPDAAAPSPDAVAPADAAAPDADLCADCNLDPTGDDGCDCAVGDAPPGAAALALLVLAALRPRRRR